MRLHLTSAQLSALDKFNAAHDDDWAITQVDDGNLEIVIYPGQLNREFERYVDTAGNITRYDQDTDLDEIAEVTPVVESYEATLVSGAKISRTYNS